MIRRAISILSVLLVSPAAALGQHRIWTPAPRTTWKWQLTTPVARSVAAQMFDIDLFESSASVVALLHRQGRRVICYLDAGTYENFRPDAHAFPSSVLGNTNGWPGGDRPRARTVNRAQERP